MKFISIVSLVALAQAQESGVASIVSSAVGGGHAAMTYGVEKGLYEVSGAVSTAGSIVTSVVGNAETRTTDGAGSAENTVTNGVVSVATGVASTGTSVANGVDSGFSGTTSASDKSNSKHSVDESSALSNSKYRSIINIQSGLSAIMFTSFVLFMNAV